MAILLKSIDRQFDVLGAITLLSAEITTTQVCLNGRKQQTGHRHGFAIGRHKFLLCDTVVQGTICVFVYFHSHARGHRRVVLGVVMPHVKNLPSVLRYKIHSNRQ